MLLNQIELNYCIEAFVTLVTNDTYALGALVLANSLRAQGTTRQIVVLVTQGVTDQMRYCLICAITSISFMDIMLTMIL